MTGQKPRAESPAHGVLRTAYKDAEQGVASRPLNDPYHNTPGALLWRESFNNTPTTNNLARIPLTLVNHLTIDSGLGDRDTNPPPNDPNHNSSAAVQWRRLGIATRIVAAMGEAASKAHYFPSAPGWDPGP